MINKIKVLTIMLISIFVLSSCDILGKSIVVPHDNDYYCETYKGSVNELVEEFKLLGFEKIELERWDYEGWKPTAIRSVSIGNSWFGFDAGDKFNSTDTVEIEYWGECRNLTIDNCLDFYKILTDATADYKEFVEKYDGKYIEFDGCVTDYDTYSGGTSHIVELHGGDFNKGNFQGLPIKVNIDVVNSDNSINKDVEEGKNVKVIGKVSDYYKDFYKRVYIYAVYLQYR